MRTAARSLRLRRLRAVLAGGLVLGVGAAATTAAWTDNEFANATFTAGSFGIVGATNGSTFSDHATAPGATLTFAATPGTMYPGLTTYGLYSVKTAATSVAGTVQLTASAANNTGLGATLTYEVRTIVATTCNAANFALASSVVVVPAGTPLTTGATGTQIVPAAGASQVNYCFAVTLPSGAANATQGQTLTAQWIFAGTSS